MSVSRWRQHAYTVIHQALIEADEQQLTYTETLKLIDSRYPFGPREHHPYAMWLKERRELLETSPTIRRAREREGLPPELPPKTKQGAAVSKDRAKLDAWQRGDPIR